MRLIALFCFVLLFTLTGWARDFMSISQSYWGANSLPSSEISTGAPPFGPSNLLLFTNLSYNYYAAQLTDLSSFRLSIGTRIPINETSALMAFIPVELAATQKFPSADSDATFTSFIANVTNRVSPQYSWSYGLIVTDRSNFHRVFPAIGFRYLTDDKLWRYNFGFPFISASYQGIEKTTIALLLGRDSSRFLIQDTSSFTPDARYYEQTFNMLALNVRHWFHQNWAVTARYGYLIASEAKTLNSRFETVNKLENYSDQSMISVALSFGMEEQN